MDGWTSVDVALPKKSGRYQVIMKNGNSYHVTMRKFYVDKLNWYPKIPGKWDRGTFGITHWKPMDKLPDGLKPDRSVLDYGGKW